MKKNMHSKQLFNSKGFTLMEVLVASAITGIALGVLMATIAQGHRQAFRGDMERKAGIIAEKIMFLAIRDPESAETGNSDVPGFEGWTYSLKLREADLKVHKGTGEEPMEIDTQDLSEMVITIVPPDGTRPFQVSRLISNLDGV